MATPIDTKTRKHFKKKVKDSSGTFEVDATKELRNDAVVTFYKVKGVSVAEVDNDKRSF